MLRQLEYQNNQIYLLRELNKFCLSELSTETTLNNYCFCELLGKSTKTYFGNTTSFGDQLSSTHSIDYYQTPNNQTSINRFEYNF